MFSLDQGSINYDLWSTCPLPVFIGKVLWNKVMHIIYVLSIVAFTTQGMSLIFAIG